MRTPAVREMGGEPGLAAKLEDEAAAWRRNRPAQQRFRWNAFRSSEYPSDLPGTRPSATALLVPDNVV